MKKTALILGVTGQDGSYLADILLKKNYIVHGLIRKSATGNKKNIQHLINDNDLINKSFFLHRGDLADPTSIYRVISEVKPNEIYNEADQDHVSWSFDMVSYSTDITANSFMRLCEIVRQIDVSIKIFQPCTSNMFGITNEKKLSEVSKLNPQSPYAIAKTFSFHTARYYRNTFGMFISTGIFFNHESPRRTADYLSRKVTSSVAKIKKGYLDKLELGDLSAKIDWGYALEYMEAAHSIMQLKQPSDYIIGTGKLHSVEELVEMAFNEVDLNWKNYVVSSLKYFRPSKTSALCADISKAKKDFQFTPRINLKKLISIMVEHDMKIL